MKPIWQQQLKAALRNDHSRPLQHTENFSAAAADLFPTVITNDMLGLIDRHNPQDPILAQFLPDAAETQTTEGFKADPVGDSAATQVPGLIHKYHGRVLLIASGSCAVNCRYCFRRHFPYSQSYAPRNNWQKSIQYIQQTSTLHEVILSGGDPLTLDTDNLNNLSSQLESIPHIKTLRIHSRIPVVLPQRIDTEFLNWAKALKLHKVMVLHINHANELSTTAQQAIAALKTAGFVLLNQSVLLKGVNDSADTLADLSHRLFACSILPYYLHQMDAVQNAAHFCIPEPEAYKIHQQLKALLPGYLTPKLVKEIAGEDSKSHIIPSQ